MILLYANIQNVDVDDSTLFEICDRKDVSAIQEPFDVAARWTEHNYMNINSEKSK